MNLMCEGHRDTDTNLKDDNESQLYGEEVKEVWQVSTVVIPETLIPADKQNFTSLLSHDDIKLRVHLLCSITTGPHCRGSAVLLFWRFVVLPIVSVYCAKFRENSENYIFSMFQCLSVEYVDFQ